MKKDNIHLSIFSFIFPVGLLFIVFSQWNTINKSFDFHWSEEAENRTFSLQDLTSDENKQRGAHVFGIGGLYEFSTFDSK